MKDKGIKILAILGVIFMTAFAVVFTLGLYFNFKEPFNLLSILFLAIGLPISALVWFFKKREQNTQELLERLNPDSEDFDDDTQDQTDHNQDDINKNDQAQE